MDLPGRHYWFSQHSTFGGTVSYAHPSNCLLYRAQPGSETNRSIAWRICCTLLHAISCSGVHSFIHSFAQTSGMERMLTAGFGGSTQLNSAPHPFASSLIVRWHWTCSVNFLRIIFILIIKYNIRTTQHNTTQQNTTQYNTTKYNKIQHTTIQHNTIQHNTTQHNTIQHITIQHNRIQYNTTQYNTKLSARMSYILLETLHSAMYCRWNVDIVCCPVATGRYIRASNGL